MTACSPGSTSKALATEAALIRISGRPPSGSTPRRGGSRICCPILVRPPPRATCDGGSRRDDPTRGHSTAQDRTVLPLGRQRPRRCTSSSGGGEGRQYSLTFPAASRLSPLAVASLCPLSRASLARLKRGGACSVPPATPELCENLPLCHERRHLWRWRATGTDCGTREAAPHGEESFESDRRRRSLRRPIPVFYPQCPSLRRRAVVQNSAWRPR